MGRAPSTISRGEPRSRTRWAGTDRTEAHQRALARRRLDRPSRLARDRQPAGVVRSKVEAAVESEKISRACASGFRTSRIAGCARRRSPGRHRPDLADFPGTARRIPRHRRRYRLRRRDAQHRDRRRGDRDGLGASGSDTVADRP